MENTNATHCTNATNARHWRRSDVFIVNFEHLSQLVLVFLLLTLNMYLPSGIVKSVNTMLLKKLNIACK